MQPRLIGSYSAHDPASSWQVVLYASPPLKLIAPASADIATDATQAAPKSSSTMLEVVHLPSKPATRLQRQHRACSARSMTKKRSSGATSALSASSPSNLPHLCAFPRRERQDRNCPRHNTTSTCSPTRTRIRQSARDRVHHQAVGLIRDRPCLTVTSSMASTNASFAKRRSSVEDSVAMSTSVDISCTATSSACTLARRSASAIRPRRCWPRSRCACALLWQRDSLSSQHRRCGIWRSYAIPTSSLTTTPGLSTIESAQPHHAYLPFSCSCAVSARFDRVFSDETTHRDFCNGGSLDAFIQGRSGSTPPAEDSREARIRRFKERRGTAQRGAIHFLRLDEIISLFRDIASGLAHLHAHNGAHRFCCCALGMLTYAQYFTWTSRRRTSCFHGQNLTRYCRPPS